MHESVCAYSNEWFKDIDPQEFDVRLSLLNDDSDYELGACSDLLPAEEAQ